MTTTPPTGATPVNNSAEHHIQHSTSAMGILDNLEELSMHGHSLLNGQALNRFMSAPNSADGRVNLGMLAQTMEELEKEAKNSVTKDQLKLLRRFLKSKPTNIDEEDAADLRTLPSLLRRLRERRQKRRRDKELEKGKKQK